MADKHEADLQRVTAENDYTDITRAGEHLPQGGGLFTSMVNGVVRTVAETNPHKNTVWGSTDFDGKNLALNQMLDLVEEPIRRTWKPRAGPCGTLATPSKRRLTSSKGTSTRFTGSESRAKPSARGARISWRARRH